MPTPSRHRLFKRLLRYVPRRAVLHKYPVIGRYAARLRPRGYLWSLRRSHLRPAYYAGSILAFLPLFGIQLPLALVLAILLRCNLMLVAGLQLVTNPLTAGPIYFLTHRLGSAVVNQVQGSPQLVEIADEQELTRLGGYVAETIQEPLSARPEKVRWTTRVRRAVAAMVVGGLIVGASVAFALDLLDRFLRRSAAPAEPG